MKEIAPFSLSAREHVEHSTKVASDSPWFRRTLKNRQVEAPTQILEFKGS
jgi:hypothetical protein